MINWQKAILLWLTQKVEVLEFHSQKVNSAHASFNLPSVMRLKRFINITKFNSIKFNRDNVFLRDQHICQFCKKEFPHAKLTLDHVVPLSQGGAHKWENVVAACAPCNNKKGGKTPEQARMPLMRRPIKPSYLPNRRLENEVKRGYEFWSDYLSYSRTG